MHKQSWEGTILAFAITFTILLGIVYSLGVVYRLTIPWVLIPLMSLGVALWVRYRR
ncbi:MAG TPA: hypothetical protein PKA05_18880 [Roseiflexaceae bacterium]|nr:hypothetical protein [Roseiflexaceae bacterium]HMP42451.1 hypothetical protein [Roseiflexaceae bacterium]